MGNEHNFPCLPGVGKIPQEKSSTQNKRFTMIGLMLFAEKPVMRILILEGGYKGNIEAGIDISVSPVGDNKDSN